jgi:PAS domain S-box-containing protein
VAHTDSDIGRRSYRSFNKAARKELELPTQERPSGEAIHRTQLFQQVLRRLRPTRSLPVWARYTAATAIVVAAYALRLAFHNHVSPAPFILFFPAIILISFALDRGSGFYATILAAALSTRIVNNGLLDVGAVIAIGLFTFVGLFCAAIIEALRLTVDELGESEQRFRSTFEVAAVGVAHVGPDGRWLRVNPALCRLLGYDEAQLLAKTFQDITHPEDLAVDLSHLQRLLRGEIKTYSIEKRYLREDESVVWILLTVALVRDPGGRPRYFISVVQDIQDRKAAEAVVLRGQEELTYLVEERTAALMRANEEQRRAEEALRQGEKLQAVGQLTGGIAHDFNNLLQVVSGGAQMLKSPRLTEERRSLIIDGLVQAAQNAKELTGRLLAFARRQPLKPETFDLNARLRTMVDPLRHTLGPRVELVMDLAEDLWPVRIDPSQLEVALLNLAVNARDAFEGCGTFTVITRNTMLGAAQEGMSASEYVDLMVRDDGPGMAPAVLSRVFEPFFTTKGPNRGTGLGLAQVHGFAKQSGGDVLLESAPGQGTTVILHLPKANTLPDEPHPSPREGPPADLPALMQRAAGKTVLVVEDNDDVADFACSMLHELGYGTARSANAKEALSLLTTNDTQFDALFSDIMMPGMSGLELAAVVRARYPRIAVLLASGYSDALGSWEGERPAEVLGKPYQLLELGAALEQSLATRSS